MTFKNERILDDYKLLIPYNDDFHQMKESYQIMKKDNNEVEKRFWRLYYSLFSNIQHSCIGNCDENWWIQLDGKMRSS